MLISRKFVLLSMPKTASTFTRSATKEALTEAGEPFEELLFTNMFNSHRPADQHGAYAQIPSGARGRSVVSVARDPYDKFLSTFKYRYWANYPPITASEIAAFLPTFPRLTLDQYVLMNLLSDRRKVTVCRTGIAAQTVQFIRMYASDPVRVLAELSQGCDLADVVAAMGAVRMLRAEHIADELADFLLEVGLPDAAAQRCRTRPRENVQEEAAPNLTDAARRYVTHNDSWLFDLLTAFQLEVPKRTEGPPGVVTLEHFGVPADHPLLLAARN